MTAYAPNWTGRLRISYFAAGAIHSQVWRYPGPSSGSGVTDLITAIGAYLTALAPILWDDFQVNAVTVADIDSAVFLPIDNPFTGFLGTVDVADLFPAAKAFTLSFVGRTTGGGPWKLTQFGVVESPLEGLAGRNFRVLQGENADVGNCISALQAGAGIILGNDAGAVAVYNYANAKDNDRWLKKVRRGA